MPSRMARVSTASSAMARYTGSASASAAPPFPSAPWQPAQFVPKSVAKSTTWPGCPPGNRPSVAPADGSRGDEQRGQRGQGAEPHRGCSRPEASMPARIESGRAVLTRCCRDTTRPATSPKPNWESTNQNQSTRLFSTGLTMPRIP